MTNYLLEIESNVVNIDIFKYYQVYLKNILKQ